MVFEPRTTGVGKRPSRFPLPETIPFPRGAVATSGDILCDNASLNLNFQTYCIIHQIDHITFQSHLCFDVVQGWLYKSLFACVSGYLDNVGARNTSTQVEMYE